MASNPKLIIYKSYFEGEVTGKNREGIKIYYDLDFLLGKPEVEEVDDLLMEVELVPTGVCLQDRLKSSK